MFLTIQLLQDMGGSCKLNSHTYFLHRILTEGKCSFLLVLFVWKAELLRNDWEHILTKGIWQKLESHKSISFNTPSELQNQQQHQMKNKLFRLHPASLKRQERGQPLTRDSSRAESHLFQSHSNPHRSGSNQALSFPNSNGTPSAFILAGEGTERKLFLDTDH